VQATCFGSYQRVIIKPYAISKPDSEESLQLMGSLFVKINVSTALQQFGFGVSVCIDGFSLTSK
jgi:hypothetical protein